jgi:hypothetical protein
MRKHQALWLARHIHSITPGPGRQRLYFIIRLKGRLRSYQTKHSVSYILHPATPLPRALQSCYIAGVIHKSTGHRNTLDAVRDSIRELDMSWSRSSRGDGLCWGLGSRNSPDWTIFSALTVRHIMTALIYLHIAMSLASRVTRIRVTQ